MTPERHAEVSAAFLRVRGLGAAERAAALEGVASRDAALAAEVVRLLEADVPEGATPLDRPLLDGAAMGAETRAASWVEGADVRSGSSAYRPVRIIGEGGASTVYLAEQVSPVRRMVALKVLRAAAGRREADARFEVERQAAAMMQHPGIAALYDAGTTALGRPFIAMEYVEGAPITEWCREHRPGVRRTLGLFVELCEAVGHAHQKGVVHRDLKPRNILVSGSDRAGSAARVKVIDFGLAKSVGAALHAASFATSHGQLVGTLAYMSPEQLEGDRRQIDVRTDVFALGAILQEMLTGRPAVDVLGLDLPAAIRRVESARREPMAAEGRPLERDLDLIVARAMAPEPGRRYQSVHELAEDVRRFLDSRPVLARGPGALYVARKFAARHRAATAALAAVAIALVGSALWVAAAHRRAERHYRVSRDTVNYLLRDVIAPLGDHIGTRPVRRALLTRVLEHSEVFAAQEADHPDVQTAWASMLGQLADLEEEEGRYERARELNERALELRRVLAERFPDDPARQADLSIALVRVGDFDRGADEAWERSLRYYEPALEIDEALAARYPDHPHYLSNLAWSYDRVAERHRRTGRVERARALYLKQIRTAERAGMSGAAADDVERCRASAFLHLAHVTEGAEQERWVVRAAEAAERALAAAPDSRLAAMMVGGVSMFRATRARDAGDVGAALAYAAEAARRLEPVSEADRRDMAATGAYVHACRVAAHACERLGDAAGASAWSARAAAGWAEAQGAVVSGGSR